MIDVVIYDAKSGWSPSLNASKGTGGTEVHLVQIAEWLYARGYVVLAECHAYGQEGGVVYGDSRLPRGHETTRALITVRHSPIPAHITYRDVVTLAVDDPRSCPGRFDHLKGRSTLVCVSEWLTGLYRDLGHDAVHIPAMIGDEVYYRTQTTRLRGRFVCLSAWNKGTDDTLAAWGRIKSELPGCRLVVGSPYSHPPDAKARCESAGATWVGELTPRAIVSLLSSAEAVFRVATIEETFGATDAIAKILGTRVHMLCRAGFGASADVLGHGFVTTNEEDFVRGVMYGREYGPRLTTLLPKDYRVSTIMPQWLPLLGLD